MIPALARRFLFEPAPRALAAFAWRFGIGGLRALLAHRRRLRRGVVFPPFLFLSITNRCNLRCQGCWVNPDAPDGEMPLGDINRIIATARGKGCRFFGLLGGEPLLHSRIWDLLGRHRDCYFQLFSNGTTIDAGVAVRLARLGNVTPLISIEGSRDVSDERRGSRDVLRRSCEGLEHCRQAGLVTGVASSLCANNLDDLLNERFIDEMIDRGALYLWYYIYRPAGAQPCPQLALSAEQIQRIRAFLVQQRRRKPIVLVDAYWDHAGRPLCPAAEGISHHVSPWGEMEPCPPIQWADRSLRDAEPAEALEASPFLADFRKTVRRETKGCVLLDRPDLLAGIIRRNSATDTSRRDESVETLCNQQPLPSHGDIKEIPETHWVYRLAKRCWFLGFGAYG